ncbi:MAG: DNA translocase FtsK [Firmicutes bacterium]|nr:DNA translocase FtsK [Bacillota bacterium]
MMAIDIIVRRRGDAAAHLAGGLIILASILSILDLLDVSAGTTGAVVNLLLVPVFGHLGSLVMAGFGLIVGAMLVLDTRPGSAIRGFIKGMIALVGGMTHAAAWVVSNGHRLARSVLLPALEGRQGEGQDGANKTANETGGRGGDPSAVGRTGGRAHEGGGGEIRLAGELATRGHQDEPLPVIIEPRMHAPEPGIPQAAVMATVAAAAEAAEGKSSPLAAGDDSNYCLPSLSLLKGPAPRKAARGSGGSSGRVIERARLLEDTFRSFGVTARVVQISKGPVVTRYEVQPGFGVKVSRIVSLADDLALALASSGIRIEAPIPGKSAVGIEVPNSEISMVYLRDVLESDEFQKREGRLTIAIGKDIAGGPVVADLTRLLHVLVAGATGSGKSVCLNTLIASILFKAKPGEVKLLMIDPKRVELTTYDGIPHLLSPVVTDAREAAGYLRWVAGEMDKRYKRFAEVGVRNIEKYNEFVARITATGTAANGEDGGGGDRDGDGDDLRPLPYIVVIIDELGDLMMVAQKDVEDVVCQLAFMARAAGIHLILATQRPSADVITGVIKMNIPSRIAFAVPSHVDSRVILDTGGAERLLGKGDMLFFPVGAPKPIRVQGAYVSDSEIESIVEFVRSQGEPTYEAESIGHEAESDETLGEEDSLFDEAVRMVVETQEASISKLQRRFRIGYNRAARLIEAMEARGIVGPYEGSRPRKVLVSPDRFTCSRPSTR